MTTLNQPLRLKSWKLEVRIHVRSIFHNRGFALKHVITRIIAIWSIHIAHVNSRLYGVVKRVNNHGSVVFMRLSWCCDDRFAWNIVKVSWEEGGATGVDVRLVHDYCFNMCRHVVDANMMFAKVICNTLPSSLRESSSIWIGIMRCA
jgi:hypothetical protein